MGKVTADTCIAARFAGCCLVRQSIYAAITRTDAAGGESPDCLACPLLQFARAIQTQVCRFKVLGGKEKFQLSTYFDLDRFVLPVQLGNDQYLAHADTINIAYIICRCNCRNGRAMPNGDDCQSITGLYGIGSLCGGRAFLQGNGDRHRDG